MNKFEKHKENTQEEQDNHFFEELLQDIKNKKPQHYKTVINPSDENNEMENN